MKYPEWAPSILIEQHKSRVGNSTERKFKAHDPETFIAEMIEQHGKIASENIEDIRRKWYRNSLMGIPDKEGTALLGKLITDPRMKDVWKALAKRIDKDKELYQFFRACENGIAGWRGGLKQTSAERKAFYQEIFDAAAKLQSLMSTADEFDHYSINALVDDAQVAWLQEVLDASNDLQYARSCLSEVIPPFFEVLSDIAVKAKHFGEKKSSVKKPNSENADIHYFARLLSEYLTRGYGQPLHEVVAATTEVVFDRQHIDSDYVRKLAR